jgi:hypothetical protein
MLKFFQLPPECSNIYLKQEINRTWFVAKLILSARVSQALISDLPKLMTYNKTADYVLA